MMDAEDENEKMIDEEVKRCVDEANDVAKLIHNQYIVLKLQVTVLEEVVRQAAHQGRAHDAAVKVIECMSEKDERWWKARVSWTIKRWLEEFGLDN